MGIRTFTDTNIPHPGGFAARDFDLELGEIPYKTSWAEAPNNVTFGKGALEYELKIAHLTQLLRENQETLSSLQEVGAIGGAIRRRYLINVGTKRLNRHPFNARGVEVGNDAAHAPRPFEDAIVCLQLYTDEAPLVSESATYQALYGVSPKDAHSWRHIREVESVLTMRCELSLMARREVRCSVMFDALFHWFISNVKEIEATKLRLIAPDNDEVDWVTQFQDNVDDALEMKQRLELMEKIYREIEREYGNISKVAAKLSANSTR